MSLCSRPHTRTALTSSPHLKLDAGHNLQKDAIWFQYMIAHDCTICIQLYPTTIWQCSSLVSTVYSSIEHAFSPTSSVARVICSHGKMFQVWCREVAARGEDKPLRAKSEDEEKAHARCFDMLWLHAFCTQISLCLSLSHVFSCQLAENRRVFVSLWERKERNPGSCLQLKRFALDSSSYSGHLEGASPASSGYLYVCICIYVYICVLYIYISL